jgi:hypothetical protein
MRRALIVAQVLIVVVATVLTLAGAWDTDPTYCPACPVYWTNP